jgi:long-chain acyl-CoA synthetase
MVQMYAACSSLSGQGNRDGIASDFPYPRMTAAMNLPIYQGWTTCSFPSPRRKSFSKRSEISPHNAPLVPTMLYRMLEHPDLKKTDLTCFKLITSRRLVASVEVLNKFKS